MQAAEIKTPLGTFTAHFSARGLARLDFPRDRKGAGHRAGLRPPSPPPAFSGTAPAQLRRWWELTAAALRGVLSGRAPEALPPFDWSAGTEFQRRVWAALLDIAPGRTQSYGDIAAAIGQPLAVRAVGGACGANPIPVLVPCHRVLAKGGRLGGFSGGLEWKRRLLAGEGVLLPLALFAPAQLKPKQRRNKSSFES